MFACPELTQARDPANLVPMTRAALRPTPEQVSIFDAFAQNFNVVVHAGAGTGKTATIGELAWMAHEQGRGGRYIAFTRAMAEEVDGLFEGTGFTASTIEALTYRTLAQTHLACLLEKITDEPVLSRFHRSQWLGTTESLYYTSNTAADLSYRGLFSQTTQISPAEMVDAALRAIDLWCQDSAIDFGTSHVDRPRSMPEDFYLAVYVPKVIELAHHIWRTDVMSPYGRLPFRHPYYTKLVQVMGLPLCSDEDGDMSVILFDEAQDSRPCVTSLLQAQPGVQLVTVGDSAQSIFGFTGAKDALPTFSQAPNTVSRTLTQTWRFGANIAHAANLVLDLLAADIRLTPNPGITDHVQGYSPTDIPATDAVITRTNTELIAETLREVGRGRKVALVADIPRIIRIADDYDRIVQGQRPSSKMMEDFRSRDDIEDFVYGGTQDVSSIRPLLRLMLTQGSLSVREATTSAVPEDKADVVVSTIHKAKGRQWPSVRIAASAESMLPVDPLGADFGPEAREKLMLLYVAMTRPQRLLVIPQDIATVILHLHDRLTTSHLSLN